MSNVFSARFSARVTWISAVVVLATGTCSSFNAKASPGEPPPRGADATIPDTWDEARLASLGSPPRPSRPLAGTCPRGVLLAASPSDPFTAATTCTAPTGSRRVTWSGSRGRSPDRSGTIPGHRRWSPRRIGSEPVRWSLIRPLAGATGP